MKKLLSILGAVVLTTTGASGIVSNNIYQKTNSKVGWKNFIDVQAIQQEKPYYCAAAVIQMILNYFSVNINQYTQDRIYQDVGGLEEEGILINLDVVNYLNNERALHGETRNVNYHLEILDQGFGSTRNEMLMFQDYIVQSLNSGAPVLFGVDAGGNDQHTVLINGIIIDASNPANTLYNYIDPSHGTNEIMYGRDLHIYCIGGATELVGAADNFDFKNKQIKISINEQSKKEYTSEGGTFDVPVNLTKEAGIVSYSQFQNVSSVQVPNWHLRNSWYDNKSEHRTYTWYPKNIPNHNDSWHYNATFSDSWWKWKPVFGILSEKIILWDSTKTSYENDDFNITFQNKIDINLWSTSMISWINSDFPKEHLDFTTGDTIILHFDK